MPLVINGEHVEDSVIDQERSYLRHRFSDACESMQPSEAEEWLKNLATHNVVSRVLLRQEAWKDPAAHRGRSTARSRRRMRNRPPGFR